MRRIRGEKMSLKEAIEELVEARDIKSGLEEIDNHIDTAIAILSQDLRADVERMDKELSDIDKLI